MTTALLVLVFTQLPDLEAYVERAEAARPARIAELREKIRRVQEAILGGEISASIAGSASIALRGSKGNLRRIQEMEAEIKSLLGTGDPPWPKIDCLNIGQGSIGPLDADNVEVFQVLGPDKFLAVAEKAVQQNVKKRSEPFFVAGVSTGGFVDGKNVRLPPIRVTGTETYQTVVGRRTVYVVEPLDLDKLREIAANLRLRTWTDSTGEYKVEAEFVGYDSGDVTLKNKDGEKTTVPLGKLSRKDQKWVRERIPQLIVN